jgi:hypothetical protein
MKILPALAASLLLVACGGGGASESAGENAAEQLEDAAEMSNPAAAPVLENGAQRIREEGGNAADAQNVLRDAGNAQSK